MQVQHPYALKYYFMKIYFENSIRGLSFLCCLKGIKIAWTNPGIQSNETGVKCRVVAPKDKEKTSEPLPG